MNWCRDVDWGTAPQWASAGAALVAVVLSSIGLGIALVSYRRSVKDAHIAQARRIHAVHFDQTVYKGQVALVKEGFAERGVLTSRIDPTDKALGFNTIAHGQVVKVTVHNNSDEIISNVAVRVRTRSVNWYPTNAGYVIQAIVPESKYDVDFVTLNQSANGFMTQVLKFEVEITFTDSVGNHWTRIGAKPVEEIESNPYHAFLGPEMITLGPDDPFYLAPRPRPAAAQRGPRLRRRTRRP